jgi:hypothetical protein
MSEGYFPNVDRHTEIVGSDGHYQVRAKGSSDTVLATVRFQRGPVREAGVNGVFIEDLLRIALMRLEFFQDDQGGKYAHVANAEAIQHVARALDALDARTRERAARGVEGTHKV